MHEYIIGRSGYGKSTKLENDALASESGWLFLDPHGDSVEKLADTVPCIYWEPDDPEHVVGFNPIGNVPKAKRPRIASDIVASFRAIWSESWGPRLEWILYNAVLLLCDNSSSLIHIPRLLTDGAYREPHLKRASYRQFWEDEFEQWDARYRNDAIAPVLNKVGQLIANPLLRNILAHNTLNMSRIMDKGQRLAVNLSKGKLGDDPSHLLGALLISSFAHAAQARASIPYEQRRPFTIFADEFQNFATDSFTTILSEARKHRLQLVLAHQFLGQVPERLRQAVFANVGTFTVFNVGAEDAPLLASQLDVHPDMLKDLSEYEAWIKTGLDRRLVKMPPPFPSLGILQSVRSRTRHRYTRSLLTLERADHGGSR